MWNLFKEKEEVKQEIQNDIIVLGKPEQTYPTVVLEIHKEFETASDKLLKQAQEAVNSAEPVASKEKISLLKKYGFNQVEEVVKQQVVDAKVELSKKQIETITYYRQNYPFNKFIFPNQVKEICEKYNLVFGEVSDYKGFVPEKNLKEIENFKLKEVDFSYKKTFYGGFMESHSTEITHEEYKKATVEKRDRNWHRNASYSKNETLRICAPIRDMDTYNKRIVDGYKLEDIPDPVVLMPVRGEGYLILTAWGDESTSNFNRVR